MEKMQKRPVSLTIIAWVLIVLSLLALVGIFTMSSNPAMVKMMAEMRVSLLLYQAWTVLGVIINLIVAYGILKGQPWSRVLYVVWGIIGLVVGFFITPQKAYLVLSLIILVVISLFLFSEKANDWFSARGLMLKREG
jgi:flagellar basal body-associated protein FliL